MFQENSKLSPAHVLIRAVCNDQTFLFQHFANPEQQFAVVLCSGSSTQHLYISNQQVGQQNTGLEIMKQRLVISAVMEFNNCGVKYENVQQRVVILCLWQLNKTKKTTGFHSCASVPHSLKLVNVNRPW